MKHSSKKDSYPKPFTQDPIKEIAPDIFLVRGTIKIKKVMQISRNMVIIRHENELTLLNSVRLDEANEKQLRELGDVKRIIRLGADHGLDDRYYMDTFKAELWATGESPIYPNLAIDKIIDESTDLPFPDAQLFCFQQTKFAEAAVLVRRNGGFLFTCDSLQHHEDFYHHNAPAKAVMCPFGFRKTPVVVGPPWIPHQTPKGGNLRPDFDRILELEFDKLCGAHGAVVEENAKKYVEEAVENAFPSSKK